MGKPLKRWSGDIEEFTASQADDSQPALAEAGYWRRLAEDRPEWKAFGEKFWRERSEIGRRSSKMTMTDHRGGG